jgi:hypothetical protein
LGGGKAIKTTPKKGHVAGMVKTVISEKAEIIRQIEK